ncbi:MAG TPA: hypothetical protein DCL54_11545 [Alphaproteobacteria bacterium]|nr:hypothetical protein [Alphaproteobacteria bacterium]HAJ47200.1 hypothetical protein [Alphaproteobacteria bacterium]
MVKFLPGGFVIENGLGDVERLKNQGFWWRWVGTEFAGTLVRASLRPSNKMFATATIQNGRKD